MRDLSPTGKRGVLLCSHNKGMEYSCWVLGVGGDFQELCISLRVLYASYPVQALSDFSLAKAPSRVQI